MALYINPVSKNDIPNSWASNFPVSVLPDAAGPSIAMCKFKFILFVFILFGL